MHSISFYKYLYFRLSLELFQLRFGLLELDKTLFIQRNVTTAVSHPSYDNTSPFLGFDIALLKLDRSLNFQKNIIPICLPKPDENFIGLSV
jgi:hypothetical protein